MHHYLSLCSNDGCTQTSGRHCFPLGDKPTPECREEVYLWQMASKLEFYSYKKDMCIGIVTTVDVCTLVFSVDECKTSHNVIKVNVR